MAMTIEVADVAEECRTYAGSIVQPKVLSDAEAMGITPEELAEQRLEELRATHSVPRTLTTSELFSQQDEDKFLIDQMLVANQPALVGGASKTMKTTLSIDAAISIATGKPFLGRSIPEALPVLFLTSEIGRNQIRKLAKRIAKSKDVVRELEESNRLHWNTWVPYIPDPEQLEILVEEIKRIGAKVVFFDPLYLMLNGDTAANYSHNAQQLRALCGAAINAGATPVCNDHAKRSSTNAKDHEPLELDDISGAGKAEYFRQWMLISRRERFDENEPHKLWLSIGGSAFAGATLAVDIDERSDTDGGRSYSISHQAASELRATKTKMRADAKAEAKEKQFAERLTAAKKLFEARRGEPQTKGDIRAHLKCSGEVANQIVHHLELQEEISKANSVKRGKNFAEAWIRTGDLEIP